MPFLCVGSKLNMALIDRPWSLSSKERRPTARSNTRPTCDLLFMHSLPSPFSLFHLCFLFLPLFFNAQEKPEEPKKISRLLASSFSLSLPRRSRKSRTLYNFQHFLGKSKQQQETWRVPTHCFVYSATAWITLEEKHTERRRKFVETRGLS